MLPYFWSKFCKKMMGVAIKDSVIHKTAKVEAQSTVLHSTMGRYSYCGYHCTISNCTIGNFCSISDDVTIGGGTHPLSWVSTSPAFYTGRDSISKKMARLQYVTDDLSTTIGHDVWIGHGVHIKPGITIATGAVIGMGSVVTKSVEPYAIVAGNPAKTIRKRFSEEIIVELLANQWWELPDQQLAQYSHIMDKPEALIASLGEMNL